MIALFDEPPRISIKSSSPLTGNGLLIGMFLEGNRLGGVVCLENGEITLLDTSFFTIDYRYDVSTDRWKDVNVRSDQD